MRSVYPNAEVAEFAAREPPAFAAGR